MFSNDLSKERSVGESEEIRQHERKHPDTPPNVPPPCELSMHEHLPQTRFITEAVRMVLRRKNDRDPQVESRRVLEKACLGSAWSCFPRREL